MRLRAIAVVCGVLVSPALGAQQRPPAPAQITPRLDNEQVRVIVATLQPHTPSISRTGHATNRVLIYLDEGAMTREEAGNTTRIEFRRGDVRWRPASGAYTSENVSDSPIRILEVDLKTDGRYRCRGEVASMRDDNRECARAVHQSRD